MSLISAGLSDYTDAYESYLLHKQFSDSLVTRNIPKDWHKPWQNSTSMPRKGIAAAFAPVEESKAAVIRICRISHSFTEDYYAVASTGKTERQAQDHSDGPENPGGDPG